MNIKIEKFNWGAKKYEEAIINNNNYINISNKFIWM